MECIFYICAFVSIVSTLFAIIQKNAIYSLLYLIISLLSISGIFFTLGAFFAGALQVIIYAGAIIVLFVFVIMMLNINEKTYIKKIKYFTSYSHISTIFLTLLLFCSMTYAIFFLKEKKIQILLINAKAVGISLFGPYILLVELVSILLLSALVVVFHIGREKNQNINNHHN